MLTSNGNDTQQPPLWVAHQGAAATFIAAPDPDGDTQEWICLCSIRDFLLEQARMLLHLNEKACERKQIGTFD